MSTHILYMCLVLHIQPNCKAFLIFPFKSYPISKIFVKYNLMLAVILVSNYLVLCYDYEYNGNPFTFASLPHIGNTSGSKVAKQC